MQKEVPQTASQSDNEGKRKMDEIDQTEIKDDKTQENDNTQKSSI